MSRSTAHLPLRSLRAWQNSPGECACVCTQKDHTMHQRKWTTRAKEALLDSDSETKINQDSPRKRGRDGHQEEGQGRSPH